MRKPKILVGEDSSVIQNLTKKILGVQNYEIISAKDGSKVMELLLEEEFSLVLLDLNMPKKDGLSIVKELRQGEGANKHVPVIAITGNAAGYSGEDFMSAGFTDYMIKPLDFDELVEKVRTHTNDEQG